MVRGINKDGCGVFLEPPVVKAAETVVTLAIETTTVTYVLFKLRVELPRIANATLKQSELKKVKEFVVSQGVWTGEDLEKALGIEVSLNPASGS